MAEYTQNYSLKKPLPNEFYDVADQNSNMDKIDSVLKNHDNLLAKKVDLDETGKIPQEQLPELDFILESEKGQPDGVAPLNKDGVLDIIYGGTKAKTAQEALKNLGAMPSYIRTVFGEDSAILDNIKEEGVYFFIDSNNDFGAGIEAGFELFVTKTIHDNNLLEGYCQRLTSVYRNQISDPISFWRTYYDAGDWSEWKQIATREKQQTFDLPVTQNATYDGGYANEYSISQNGVVTVNARLKVVNAIGQFTVAQLPVGFRPTKTIVSACEFVHSENLNVGVYVFADGNINIGLSGSSYTGSVSFAISFIAGG